jgi:hypothetical protein
VSFGIPFHLKKKVRGGYELPGADMLKPYVPKYGQGKNKNRPVSGFFTKITCVKVMNFITVKVSTLYIFFIWNSGNTQAKTIPLAGKVMATAFLGWPQNNMYN